ncbi:MAG: 4Fe-4S binding protein [Asgard group archaeon]|nr:4Fe-4S binding protein [Asgard group archaeon]
MILSLPAHERITYRIEIDTSKCTGCNNCTVACPVNARIRMDSTKNYEEITEEKVIAIRNGVAQVINPFKCDGDGICLIVCPQDCITLSFIPLSDYEDAPKQNVQVKTI